MQLNNTSYEIKYQEASEILQYTCEKEVREGLMDMKEVRNPADRLVCRVNEITGAIEILEKGWVTFIQLKPNMVVEISHRPKEVA